MRTLCFTVPGRPRAKARARVVRGHAFTPEKTRADEAVVWAAFREAAGPEWKPHAGPVRMTVAAFRVLPASWSRRKREAALASGYWTSRPDADNVLKLVKDALNGTAYVDDAQVADVRVVKRWGDEDATVVSMEFL